MASARFKFIGDFYIERAFFVGTLFWRNRSSPVSTHECSDTKPPFFVGWVTNNLPPKYAMACFAIVNWCFKNYENDTKS